MNRSTFHTIGAVAATAVMLASCAKNEVISRRPSLDPDAIAFNVSSGFVPADMPESKSGGQAEEKPAVLLGDNGDTLYLHPSVVPNDRGLTALPETRDVPIRNAGGINSFFVTAKINDGGGSEDDVLYIDDEEVKRVAEGGSIWTTSEGQHFWPDGQTTLDFYAYSNLTFSDGSEGSTAPAGNMKMEDGTLSFSYTVPGGTTAGTGTPASADAAKQQPDILFSLASASRSQTTDGDGTVDLNFEHALAGVQFRAKNIAGGTIKSIEIKNVYGEGDCTYSLLDSPAVEGTVTKNGTFKWTTTGDKVDFSQAMDVKVQESSTLPERKLQDVTTGDNNEKMTFMMIPQSTEGVEVEIELEGDLDKKTYTVSGKLSGPDASSPIEWEAGNIYIYDISTDSINWTYVFEVTPSITLPLGQTSATYIVTSYRYRTQLGNTENSRESVPWTATNTSFSETNLENNQKVDNITYDQIVKSFTDNGGETGAIANSYQIELEGTTMHTTHDNDEHTLRNNQTRGSDGDFWDLSTHDLQGNSIPQSTANCYVVNADGYYKLPLVYGNAIQNGSTNSSAYNNSAFTDYKNNQINSPYITGADDATLVWSDGFFMFKDIKLSNDKKYLTFRIDPDYLQQANAVLAVRDADDYIMWSWHIWVTERDVYSTTHTITDYFNQNNTFELMSCNLGWVDGKMVYYNQRDLAYQFTQAGSGKTAPMTVLQEGETFDYKDVGSTYYQWGRKDPLVAMRNWENVRFNDYRLHETGRSDYVYKYEENNVTIGESIQHPNVYYVRGTTSGAANWCSSNIPSLWDTGGRETSEPENVISSTKTIYDPSPRGFKVPIPRAFAVFVNGSHGDGGQGGVGSFNGVLNGEQVLNGDVKNQYKVWTKPNGQGYQIPFTATGQRADKAGLSVYMEGDNAGELGGLWSMYGVYYWTCVAFNNITGYSFVVRHDQPDTNPKAVRANSYRFNGTKTMARPVRPIKE